MNYNSGCSHLLIAILQKLTGTSAKSYADKNLFSHLGINEYLWHEDPQGINIGGFGLHMSISDMHKFGSLYLRNGVSNNKQLLSDEWITYTTRPNLLTYNHIGYYGRHWWAPVHSPEHPYYYAMGMGGQYICIDSTNEVVIALTCDTYGDTLKPLRAIDELLA
ncbi:serine hydrolase domain-containing protein [Paenibacillus sp. GCM10023252]|uniref:serine hydrolase domain-containing protein n=1 Tax=Paenibacillus sp. GCM10023252 TaxID=3252649 RepID=UPI0036161FFB